MFFKSYIKRVKIVNALLRMDGEIDYWRSIKDSPNVQWDSGYVEGIKECIKIVEEALGGQEIFLVSEIDDEEYDEE